MSFKVNLIEHDERGGVLDSVKLFDTEKEAREWADDYNSSVALCLPKEMEWRMEAVYVGEVRRRSEMTQLEYLKASIEDGDSIVYACEQVDLDEMRAEGDIATAYKIEQLLVLAEDILGDAGVE